MSASTQLLLYERVLGHTGFGSEEMQLAGEADKAVIFSPKETHYLLFLVHTLMSLGESQLPVVNGGTLPSWRPTSILSAS